MIENENKDSVERIFKSEPEIGERDCFLGVFLTEKFVQMWFGYPLVVFEQSSGEFGNAAHRDPSEIKGLDPLALVHVGDVLLGHKRRFGVVKVQIGESVTSEELCGKSFEKVLVSLLLGNGPFGENLHIIKTITHSPLLDWTIKKTFSEL